MPRLIFKKDEDMVIWAAEFATKERFVVYSTEQNEIILYPTKSTKPMNIGYIKTESGEKLLEKLGKQGFIKIALERIEWDIEKAVGVIVQ